MLELCDGVDLLIHDAQHTPAEYEMKRHWGHCTVDYALHVAKRGRRAQRSRCSTTTRRTATTTVDAIERDARPTVGARRRGRGDRGGRRSRSSQLRSTRRDRAGLAMSPSRGRVTRSSPTPRRFRTVLGHFATGVTVITAMDGDEPVGMACNSFTSVSLDPPLVLFCAAKSSTTWPRIERAGTSPSNVLDEDRGAVSRLFAQKGADRFAQVAWHVGRTGAPILEDVHAFLDCTLEAEHDAGDHVIVVGRVLDLGITADGRPLLFYQGGYGRFDV